MKTALDILTDWPGTSVATSGQSPVYITRVSLAIGEEITAYGSTLASAEDTAWHGVKITLES